MNTICSQEEIIEKVKEILCSCIPKHIPKEQLTIESELQNLGITSLRYVKIITEIEEAFDFEFNDEDLVLGKFKTINSLILYIEEKVSSI
ncbi:phosphopantetheine-binding protein [Bacillus hominis]|uniref:acyl carrier protein n=1 Tax=Bacillus hominis TaxID=2817478 RepID=UPI00259FED8F|nr:phosphopantetheine-binding protein [Bacillus hominis]MDM5436484.1 phosphopantetheine-binding protein [Bacillus hominis]